jgi:predicted RNA binding protein YcfA (HicA-like mRNA interferase family)
MRTHFYKPTVEALKKAGYELARHSMNSHQVYRKENEADIIVPTKINDKNLAKRLLKKAGLTL